jgi:pyochelin biosynthetic protein PchC
MSASGTCLRAYRRVARPRLRLVCFPHAGAGPTAYRGWAGLLPSDVELLAVCYPGRQDRFGEPFAASVRDLVDGIAAALVPLPAAPLALFGHSMGALVAYEVAARLEITHRVPPAHLFVSGRGAPGRTRARNLYLMDDEALTAEVRRLGDLDPEVFAVPDLRDLVLSVLRADYRLIETHRPRPVAPLTTPVVAYVGDRDPGCPPDDARAWAEVTASTFTLRVFPGDHFYLVPRMPDVVGDVLGRLAGTLAAR